MSGQKINVYGSTLVDLTNMMQVLDATRNGFPQLSLTNYSTTSVPAIASGGHVEVAGSLFQFSTEEAISTSNVTSTANGVWYIEIVPSSSICSAQFSTTVPAWREDYSGYYNSTSNTTRTIGRTNFRDGSYYGKTLYYGRDIMKLNYESQTLSTSFTVSLGSSKTSTGTKTFGFSFNYDIASIVTLQPFFVYNSSLVQQQPGYVSFSPSTAITINGSSLTVPIDYVVVYTSTNAAIGSYTWTMNLFASIAGV